MWIRSSLLPIPRSYYGSQSCDYQPRLRDCLLRSSIPDLGHYFYFADSHIMGSISISLPSMPCLPDSSLPPSLSQSGDVARSDFPAYIGIWPLFIFRQCVACPPRLCYLHRHRLATLLLQFYSHIWIMKPYTQCRFPDFGVDFYLPAIDALPSKFCLCHHYRNLVTLLVRFCLHIQGLDSVSVLLPSRHQCLGCPPHFCNHHRHSC